MTRSTTLVFVLLVLLAVTAAPAMAQDFGTVSVRSPYRDIPQRFHISGNAGWWYGNAGFAGVGPTGGPFVGTRFDMQIGAPLLLTGRLGFARPERTVLDPAQPVATRVVGTETVTLGAFDVGFTLVPTGRRTWNRIQPLVSLGAGVVSDLGAAADAGGYRLGTPFAIHGGAGVRYVPDGRVSFRVDVNDHLFQLRYPQSYSLASATAGEAILAGFAGNSEWKHNPVISVGLTYSFGR